MKTDEQNNYWLIDTSGNNRNAYGPYSLSYCKKNAGAIFTICRSDDLESGQKITRGELKAAIQSGRVRIADGSNVAGFVGD